LQAHPSPEEQHFFRAFRRATNVESLYPEWIDDNAPKACVLFNGIIKCNEEDHIIFLRISEGQLEGVIPSQIGLLTHLTYLDFGNTKLSGSIPAEIGNLHDLRILTLENSQITGSLPDAVIQLTQLRAMIFPPGLKSTIPENIGDLAELSNLVLLNNFYGTIPESIGKLSKLTLLYINSGLEGTLPSSMNQLSSLQFLELFRNNFEGTIPGGFYGLTSLNGLSIDEDNLSGYLQISSFSQLRDIFLSTPFKLCGCFSAPNLRQCELNHSIISCNCTIPDPCPPIPCTNDRTCETVF